MWRIYQKEHKNPDLSMKQSYYSGVFTKFYNIGFETPRTDTLFPRVSDKAAYCSRQLCGYNFTIVNSHLRAPLNANTVTITRMNQNFQKVQ
ncbi:hypothetical protein PR048_005683 [Dryococelus australis]|uniref:Uncharacterized protein n=1 Tax=Dryococelus australis TaxID=614101 RepID=A0ABQ9I8U9_9NEOP|nr:hypothetical protein PR048_005683 [Dryococelus australis]